LKTLRFRGFFASKTRFKNAHFCLVFIAFLILPPYDC